ncbi:hypothetical protein EHP00_2725 [Ecytonucleospora hepatopenaei]|uniref:Sumo2-a n=1 Tax=Ecytonucleospora hepatopenaei TaxID=646526 RepID=A0A1W0E452_9MICR|nr:sumo2-a [Ecytonucleospora hepatopenaei]OQS54692.1 hypothetical protein EHP00_2725 [Ecytonucleospora hepatopenaei]
MFYPMLSNNDDNSNLIDDIKSNNTQNNDNEHIYINIKNSNGNIVKIRAKRKYKVGKILSGYCDVKKVNPSEYRLIHDGEFLAENQTLENYNIKDQDILTIVTQQTGGCHK